MRFLNRLMNTEGGGTGVTPPAAPPAAPPVAPPAAPPSWTTGFAPDLAGYAELKGFKDPAAVVESYRNFEKLHGVPQERLLKLPEKDDSPEWNDIHTRLGKPAKADEYKIEAPEGIDPGFTKWFQETIHGLGLSKKQGEGLAGKWSEHIKGALKANQDAQGIAAQQQDAKLKQEWGAAHDQNVGIAKKAVQAFGLDGDTIDKLEAVMGYDGVMKFMHSIGSKVGEDPFAGGGHGGNNFTGILSPQAAQQKLQALKQDPQWSKRYLEGGASEQAEMTRLIKMGMGLPPT